MGNDGGRIGKNYGISAAQVEKHGGFGAAVENEPRRNQHRANVPGSKGLASQGIQAVGPYSVSRPNGTSEIGTMRAANIRDLRAHLTEQVGRSGNVRNFNVRTITGWPTKSGGIQQTYHTNASSQVRVQVKADGGSKRAAVAALNQALRGSGKAGFERSGGITVTQNPNGTYTATQLGTARGSPTTQARMRASGADSGRTGTGARSGGRAQPR